MYFSELCNVDKCVCVYFPKALKHHDDFTFGQQARAVELQMCKKPLAAL